MEFHLLLTAENRDHNATFANSGHATLFVNGSHILVVPAVSITFNPTIIELDWNGYEATLRVTYSNYTKGSVLKPIVHNEWIGEVNEKYAAGDTYTYDIKNILQNKASTLREGTITFMCKDLLGNDFSQEFTITQGAAPSGSLTVSPTSKTISADGGQIEFTITFNNSEYYWVTNDNDWITIPTTGNSSTGGSTSPTYTITISKNTGDQRKGIIYFYCHGHDGTDIPVEVTITQEAAKKESFMYIGYVPDPEYKINNYSDITSDMILNGVSKGEIAKSDATGINKAGFGNVPAESFLLIALPQNSGLSAVKWVEALQIESPFTVDPLVNGEVSVNIDGETYLLYGELTPYKLIKDTKEIHYRIK